MYSLIPRNGMSNLREKKIQMPDTDGIDNNDPLNAT